MLRKILKLEGVKKLSKSNLNSIRGNGCSCTSGDGGTYHPPRGSGAHGSLRRCWSYCDRWRADTLKQKEGGEIGM